ncbi:MAG TPA: chemotaxis protein CheB [Terriglobia bacterium]|nr:chemotaxis protein CheB [Terriglobia bacterium]
MAFQIITIGTSLGGFHALKTLLGVLPQDFPLPVAVVQHRSFEESDIFATLLASHLQLPVLEVEDKQRIEGGRIYICPANYHLLVERSQFALSTDAPVLYARPAIDVLFESAADSFADGVVGILLTGMSRDGSAGLRKIKEKGGYTVVQDPSTAEGRTMPQSAISSMLVDRVLPIDQIGPFVLQLCADQRGAA